MRVGQPGLASGWLVQQLRMRPQSGQGQCGGRPILYPSRTSSSSAPRVGTVLYGVSPHVTISHSSTPNDQMSDYNGK